MKSDFKPQIDFNTVFASNIHDIKNLLFNLLGTLDQAIIESHGGPEGKRMEHLRFNGQRINDKLVQLLAIYKMSASHCEPDIEHHSVREFIEDQLAETGPLAEARGITLESQVEEDITWIFDRNLLDGVMANALHNALAYAKGRVLLSVRKERDDFLVLSVSDDGPGYPDKMLRRADGERGHTNFKTGSTGLGLYFCDVVAAAHHAQQKRGFIKLSNGGLYGGGTFEVWLP
jgi:signal transduction histidine kinase